MRSAEESAAATMGRRSCIFSSPSQLGGGGGRRERGRGGRFLCRFALPYIYIYMRHLEGHILTTPKYGFLLREGPSHEGDDDDDDYLLGKSFASSNQRLLDFNTTDIALYIYVYIYAAAGDIPVTDIIYSGKIYRIAIIIII